MNEHGSIWFDYLPAPFIVLNEQMDFVNASRAAYSMFRSRFRPTDRQKSLANLSERLMDNPSFLSLVGAATMRLTKLGSRETVRWQNADRTYDIEIFTLPPEKELHFGLLFEDVTQRLLFERSRETSRTYLEQMIDSLPLGIVVVDCDMRITAMNKLQQHFLQMNGTRESRLDVVGSNIMDWLPEQENVSWGDAMERLSSKREPLRGIEYTSVIAGTEHIFTVDLIPLIDKHCEVIGAMHVTEDITERRRLEAEAHESEVISARLDTLKQIVVTLNHVVNNTLTGIICNIEVVRSIGEPLPQDKTDLLNDVTKEAHSIAAFIRDLTDIKEIKTTDYLEGEKMLDVSAGKKGARKG